MKKALVAAQQTSEGIIADAQKKAAAILNDAEQAAQHKEESLRSEFAAEQQRVERAKSTAQDFIDAVEREVRQHLSQLEALKRMAGPLRAAPQAAPRPAAPAAPAPAAEPDLVAQIGSAVQEIADREVRTAAPKTPVRDAGVRFENLQFGKNVPGTR